MVMMMALAVPAQAQETVVIDLNEQVKPFSEQEYAALVACTLERHPDETRRYAQYHFNRRDAQTPDENVADVDSDLGISSISTCYQFEDRKPIPFSLDRLIGDWANHHGVKDTTGVQTIQEFANCAANSTPSFAHAYLNTYRSTSKSKITTLSLLVRSMGVPPCIIRGDNVQIKFDELYGLFDKILRGSRGKS